MDTGQNRCPLREGKGVTLEEAEHPWYKGGSQWTGVGSDFTSATNAPSYPQNFIEDQTKPHRGYGYSYSARQGEACDCPSKKPLTEGFQTEEKGWNWLWIIFFVILVGLLLSWLGRSTK